MCKNCKIVEQTFQAAGAEPFAFICSVNPAGKYSFWERAFAGYQNTAK